MLVGILYKAILFLFRQLLHLAALHYFRKGQLNRYATRVHKSRCKWTELQVAGLRSGRLQLRDYHSVNYRHGNQALVPEPLPLYLPKTHGPL